MGRMDYGKGKKRLGVMVRGISLRTEIRSSREGRNAGKLWTRINWTGTRLEVCGFRIYVGTSARAADIYFRYKLNHFWIWFGKKLRNYKAFQKLIIYYHHASVFSVFENY